MLNPNVSSTTMKVENSSIIEAIMYEVKEQNLIVWFKKTGSAWKYKHVPVDIYCDLFEADSLGGYFLEHIKPHYEAEQVNWDYAS